MSGSNARRLRDVDHSDELLVEYVGGAKSTQTSGPIPEFLAKKGPSGLPRPTSGTEIH